MKLKINNSSEIIAYADHGDIDNSIDYQGTLPDDFEANFRSKLYLLQNNEIIVNPNYEEPSIDIPTPEPSEPSKEWQAINMLALQVAQLKAEKGGA